MKYFLPFFFGLFSCFNASAQKSKEWSAIDIYTHMKKLGNLGSVLYIAAHPDDENTSVIAYFNNAKHYETTYLSLTRGDGGQNLIGPEIQEQLGVIRTQELLAARAIDGGHQRFSRANDFGYSKMPKETFELWNKDSVLYDMIWAIRTLKPDIIINRFDHRTPGTTHGHHTASAMLSYEAFDLAGDPNVFPEQLEKVSVWQPQRLFFNTSWWFYGSQERFEAASKENMAVVDVGTYYPLLGRSNNEISAESRSQHRCQGFGRIGDRGSSLEYMELLKGKPLKNKDPFEGITTDWTRLKGGEKVHTAWSQLLANFDFNHPSQSVESLANLYQLIQNMEDNPYKKRKLEECKTLILACTGLFIEPLANDQTLVPGQEAQISFELINRSEINTEVVKYEILPLGQSVMLHQPLNFNEKVNWKDTIQIPTTARLTNPYWLNQAHSIGMYKVAKKDWIGLPETPRYLNCVFTLKVADIEFTIEESVKYKVGEPDKGEIYMPLEIIPKYTLDIAQPIIFFNNDESIALTVNVTNHYSGVDKDTLRLRLPDGYSSHPNYYLLDSEKDQYTFELSTRLSEDRSTLSAEIRTGSGQIFNRKLNTIRYDHIPKQTILSEVETTVVKLNIHHQLDKIGYIQGAGDRIPEFLRAIGIACDELVPADLYNLDLSNYDAIVLGIRALNTLPELSHHMEKLFDYAYQGGNLILQYNTNRGLKTDRFSPYPITLSRDRITDENSPVKFLNPNHPVLNKPNKITLSDFEGWIQERGLYFPNQWANEFEAILSFQDPDEDFIDGGLLIAPYGKGNYIYTGISWFREIPAGVPGAYKLFINLLELNQNNH